MSDNLDKLWISHSKIQDYLHCPRLYYLKNIYKDPVSKNKISVVSPYLSLGLAVHDTLDILSKIPTEERISFPFLDVYNRCWKKYKGKVGGFRGEQEESDFKLQGRDMIQRVEDNLAPLLNINIQNNQLAKVDNFNEDLASLYLSEDEGIILCGKLDWIEISDNGAVRIIDFKTGKNDENMDSPQLYIYYLLASSCQPNPVGEVAYWYLDRSDIPLNIPLINVDGMKDYILKIAREILISTSNNEFKCKSNGCKYCNTYEAVLRKDLEFIGGLKFGSNDDRITDAYFLR
jgi:hypothetical protein